MKEKLKKYLSKKEYIVFLIALVITLGSLSYAFFISTDMFNNNIATTECFKLTLVGNNDINLDKTYPLSESEGSSLTPYTFTIKNVCNKVADYQVNIETLNTSSLDTNYLRIKLDNNESSILKSHELNETNINQNVKEGRKITTGTLRADEEKTYNLRMWIDENATVEQSANKEYHGKVTVSASPNHDVHDIQLAYIVDGVQQDAPPAKGDGYIISNVECENADGEWDNKNWRFIAENITGKVSCDLTFEEATYNMVPKWLATANINKSYTELSEVLNDTDTLNTLITTDVSCDYLKESTDWINDVTSNETAMTYIGNNDYCGDLLFADDNWGAGIVNSSYWNKVVIGLIPVMTSATAPSGKVTWDNAYLGQEGYKPYNAFSSASTGWWNGYNGTGPGMKGHYIAYEFPEAVLAKVGTVKILFQGGSEWYEMSVHGSNDGENWTKLVDSGRFTKANGLYKYAFGDNHTAYKYYKWYIDDSNNANSSGIKLQIYGR